MIPPSTARSSILEASRWEWHGDGTTGEDDRGSGLRATAPARAMGEARPGRHELRWQAAGGGRGSGTTPRSGRDLVTISERSARMLGLSA